MTDNDRKPLLITVTTDNGQLVGSVTTWIPTGADKVDGQIIIYRSGVIIYSPKRSKQ